MVDSGWWALTVNSPLHDWSRADLLTLAGVAATVVTAAFPPFRRAVLRGWWAAAVWAGWPQRRYARWFAQTWGVYDNPYLQEQEWLDLGSTYVPLSIRRRTGPGAGTQTLTIATAVLADEAAGNLVILGDPGSGKFDPAQGLWRGSPRRAGRGSCRCGAWAPAGAIPRPVAQARPG